MTVASTLVLLHTMDPRGRKLGGIETHVRLVLARHPDRMSVLLVGIDETGDLPLGKPIEVEVEGRCIVFLPVAHVPAAAINVATKTVSQSTTLRFALGCLRYLGAIRRTIRKQPACCEIERFEFAIIAKLLGLPLVVMVHNEGTRRDAMDSLLKRYWFLHLFNERLALIVADRIYAVNSSIEARIAGLSRRLARKTTVMSVSVDTQRFRPTPFANVDDAFHVCFAGRLDAFKDPPLMLATIAALGDKLAVKPAGRFRRVVFDYVGASDVQSIPGYPAVAPYTVHHGIRAAHEVGQILRRAHAGIITSFFEGMPCFLLEMLASGRPVAAIRLPQFVPLIRSSVSGDLVDRQATPQASAQLLADILISMADAIDAGRTDPHSIAALIRPYAVETQMRMLFVCHEALANRNAIPPTDADPSKRHTPFGSRPT